MPAYRVLPPKVLKGLSGGHPVHGFDARTSRRIGSKSTATSDYYQNADGSYTRKFAEGPVNYRDRAGAWQPIDTTLVNQAGRWAEKANSVRVSFAASGGSGDLATVGVGAGRSVSSGLAGAAPVRGVVSGSVITYPGVLPKTDLVARPTAGGMEESLILHSASAASSWVYPLSLTGLRPVMAADGAVDLVGANGETAAVLPAAYAYDAKLDPRSGEPAITHAVTYRLTTIDGKPALVVTLDRAWLHSPARVFPVTVDPSTLNVFPVSTYAESGSVGDHSLEETMSTGSFDSGTHSAVSYLQFPGTGLDGSHVTVASASLSLFDIFASTCTAERFDVAPVTQAWTPSGVTSYPGPSFGASIGNATPSVPQACANTSLDPTVGNSVTVPLAVSQFQAWANGTAADNGLAVFASTTDSLHWKQFGSAYDPAGAPGLTITYTGDVLPAVSAQFPADQHVAQTLTPALSAVGSIDGSLGTQLKFDFQVFDASGTKIVDSGLISGTSNPGSASWTVPAGKLQWEQSYYWTVQANDGTNFSAAPVFNSISTQVPQPAITSLLSQNTGGHGFDPTVGNYTTSATDADVTTVGPSLTVERDYNSLDPRATGSFGASWSSVFDARAAEQYDSTGAVASVAVTYPDGSGIGYGKNVDGSFTAPAGRFATLRSVTGGYTLTDKNDTRYTFAQSLGSGVYGITAITDSSGRAVNFTWTSGEITAMTSAVSGRALHLTWSTPTGAAHPHVATVATDPVTPGDGTSALTWTYGYAGDQLTSVCAPGSAGKCTTYSYAAGSDNFSATLDESPGSFWPLSEASGTTAASAVLANEGSDNATYSNVTLGQPGPQAGGSATAATFDGTSSKVTLPNLQLYDTYSETVSLWFKTTVAGGVLLSAQDNPIAASETKGNFEPVLYIGTGGDLNGLLWRQITANPILSPTAVNDGKWHQVVLSGSPQAQTMWVDGQLAGTQTGAAAIGFSQIVPSLLAHDYVGTGFIGADWPHEPHQGSSTVFSDPFNGSVADVSYFDRSLTQADVTAMYNAGSTQASLLSGVTQPSGDSYATVNYDGATSRVTQVTDENGGTWKLGTPSMSGSSDVYRTAVLGAGPQDYWRLGDGAGTAQPANEVHGGTATYNNATLGQAGPFADETAASFNGTSSYAELPQGLVTGAGNQSVSLWFKTTTPGGVLFSTSADPITNGTTDAGYTSELYLGTGGAINAEFWNGTAAPVLSSGPLTDGNWHNIVLAAGTTSQSLYVDGKLAGTLPGTIAGSGQNHVYLGAGFLGGAWPNEPHHSTTSNTGFATYFTGTLGEVAFYGTQLTGAQASAMYQASRNSAGLAPVTTVHVTDPGGKTLSYEYDPLNGNREIAAIDGLGHKTSYGYDTGGFMHTVTDPDGNVTTTGHDPRGNTVSTTACQDQATSQCSTVYQTFYPDDTSGQLSTADPRNDQVLTIRDGRSASATDPAYQTSYTYSSAGYVTALTTPPVPGFPGGRTTSIAYSDGTATFPAADSGNVPAGLPVKIVSPGGATQAISYFHDGDIASTTNADGLVTKYTYDGLGRVLTKTEVSDTYPNGLVTSYGYDGENRVVTETTPGVRNSVTGAKHTAQTTTVYDPDGNVASQTVADTTGGDASRTIGYTYDGRDQVASQTDAANDKTSYTYDAYGNKATETDVDNNVTSYTYDPNGNLLNTTLQNFTGDPANPSPPASLLESSRAYDPAGRLASVTDAMGDTTSYTYTDNGLLATVTRKNPAGTTSYVQEADSYDAAGNLVKKVTNNGATTTTYGVDAADRITGTTEDPTGADRATTVAYTPDDEPATVTHSGPDGATQVTSYTYDAMGNQTSEAVHTDGAGHPTGWWKLSQTSGSIVQDSSGTGNTAHATAVTWSGGAANFAGTGAQGISTNGPVLNTTASFSVSAWVNIPTAPASNEAVVTQAGTNTAAVWLLYSSSGKWEFDVHSADSTAGTVYPVFGSPPAGTSLTGTWTHLVGSYNASTGSETLYVDGTSAGTLSGVSVFGATGPLQIGEGLFGGSESSFLNGSVDNVQVYPRVLSSAEVSALYKAGRNGGSAASSAELTTTWALDKRGLPTSMTDPNSNTTGYTYDEAGHLSAVVEPAVSTETGGGTPVIAHPETDYGYDTFGDQSETKDPNGKVTTTGYDGDGHVTSQSQPPYTPPGSTSQIIATTTSSYDGNGNLIKKIDPLNNATAYTYDQLGDLATVTNPDNGVTHYTYDTNGDQRSATGPTGAQTQATYDFLGRQLTSTAVERFPSAEALTTQDAYTASATDPGGSWPSSVTTPDGVVTSYGYDNLGEKNSVTDGAGNKTGYSYDFLGRQNAVTAPDGTQRTTSYDALGDPVQVQQLDSSHAVLTTRSATYDGDGNMLSATDANDNTTTYSYGATGLLAQEVQPVTDTSAITTSFGYDAAGNQTRYTDGNGSNWITSYNSWNLPESRVEPATSAYSSAADSTFTTAYDADGRPATQTEPGGVSVSNSYDQMGRLTGQAGSGADAPTATRSFTYDTAGNVRTASTAGPAATSETFTYNDRGKLLTASGSAGTSSFGYNGDGLLASRTDAAGTTSYTYDNADRLSGLTDPATGAALTYGYNRNSQLTSVSYGPGGDTRSYGYNSQHELTSDQLKSSSGSVIASISYDYDSNGNLTFKNTTGLAGASVNTYGYDYANRLTSWSNGSTTTSYGYDANGNRTQVGSATYAYDARDELTSDGTTTYSYTARGTLASQANGSGTIPATADAYGQQATDGSQSYAYDALGRMTAVTPSSGVAAQLSYSGSADLLASDGSSTYTWTPGGSLVGVGVVGGTASQGVLAMTDLHSDMVGEFTASGASLAASVAYDPLGNVLNRAGAMAGRLGYQSAFTDPVTGKVLMGARWYDPSDGVFTSRDSALNSPVPDSVAANPFAYGDDDPLTGIDPTGHGLLNSAWHWAAHTYDSGRHWVAHTWDSGRHWVAHQWDNTTSFVARTARSAWHSTVSAFDSALGAFDAEMAAIEREIRVVAQELRDLEAQIRSEAARAVHVVTHVAHRVYHQAVHVVATVYHETKRVAETGASWVKHHAASIVSVAAGAAVFVGCEAATAGVGTVGCAAAAGAVGNLVSYGMTCGSAGGCSVTGALVSAGAGAVAGAVGGALAGPLGGKLAGSALGDLLPSFAVRGLVGAAAGAASGGAGSAAGYAGDCAAAGNCSWSGLGRAVAGGAEAGAIGGGIGGAASPDLLGAACGGQSFAASTKVVLADGKTEPISKLRPGQKVLATSTRTGKNQPETITAVLIHHDTNLYNLTVRSGRHTGVIHTTTSHLYWVPRRHGGRWVKAAALRYGTHLRTPAGDNATAAGGQAPRQHDGWMWDLTIQQDHDFYAAAGGSAVLVHNCGPQEFPNLEPENMHLDEGDAIFFGVTPAAPGTGAFDRAIATAQDGVIKWTVTKGLGLRIMPSETADTIDLYHSVLSGGDPVLAAGEAKVTRWEGRYYGEYITYHSGHFQPEEESLDIGINAFEDAGIEFNETGSY